MDTLIAVVIVLAIVGAAAAYIVRAKRRGVKCIGCDVKSCSGSCSCCSGCHTDAE